SYSCESSDSITARASRWDCSGVAARRARWGGARSCSTGRAPVTYSRNSLASSLLCLFAMVCLRFGPLPEGYRRNEWFARLWGWFARLCRCVPGGLAAPEAAGALRPITGVVRHVLQDGALSGACRSTAAVLAQGDATQPRLLEAPRQTAAVTASAAPNYARVRIPPATSTTLCRRYEIASARFAGLAMTGFVSKCGRRAGQRL